MSRWVRLTLLSLGAIVVLMLAIARIASRDSGLAEPPPVLGQVPAFSLTNQLGESVTQAELSGGPWVASFIFTRCALSCPRMVSAMKQVRATADVRMVAVTVDPDHDTVEVLADYAAANQVAAPDWWFLTGEKAAIRRLSVDGFKLGLDDSEEAAAASPDEPIVHSIRLVLVDSTLAIRGYYDPFEEGGVDRLVTDLYRVEATATQ